MNVWAQQGCPVCRRLWESGQPPPKLATSLERHAHLHRCDACTTYWIQEERYALEISETEAQKKFPAAFS
jgi:hypothetical protein